MLQFPLFKAGNPMDRNIERFIKYVKIDTQSDDQSFTVPSQEKELNLTRELAKDLKGLGIDSEIDQWGVLYAKLPGVEGLDPIGLNAHVDTALELSGKDVKPQIIENYDGGVIKLNEHYSMSPEQFETLGQHIGDTLIVTSGDTLLGADDKAGLAIIMAVLDYFVSHPDIPHHPICICFTPDEEIGRGPDHFDAKKFGAAFAYTLDGGIYNEIALETFNAAHADIVFHGVSIHPGEAKGKLVNAANLAIEFDTLLPVEKRPQFTCGREGFNHLVSIEGGVDQAKSHYIIRNHDRALLEEQKIAFENAVAFLRKKYPTAKIELTIENDYRNMKEILDQDPRAIEAALRGYRACGIEPVYNPIRGGTDGATFSFKGCPCPNLGTGSYNHHGRYEYLSVNEFNKMVAIVIEILKA